MEGRPSFELVIPRVHPSSQHRTKTLSVNEALKYTPLTTSVLHASDQVPVPTLTRWKENGRITSASERKLASRIQCAPAVKQKLETLLNHEMLAEIKFRHPTRSPPSKKCHVSLTPLAKMAMDTAAIEYRYPSPTPTETPPKSTPKSALQPGSLLTPASTASEAGNVMIEIPPPPSSFRREDYAVVPDSPKRRKLNADARNTETSLRLRTQREMGDGALLQFQNLLIEIFEAQDRLEPDTSNNVVQSDSHFFCPPEDEDESELRLSIFSLEKLQSSLKHLVAFARLSDIPSEHIKRLQRLCEYSIDTTQILNLQLGPSPSDDDRETWRSHILKAENGANSACTYIYSVLGSQHDESLVSAEVIRWLPNVLVNIFENCLIPVVEARPDTQNVDLYESACLYQNDLKRLLESGKKLLDLVASLCVQVQGAADFVNATEFLAAKLIFVQNAFSDKSAALGSQNYERTRKQAMSALAKLYAAFPNERSAILDEVLSSLDKLPSTSRSARQCKLGDGKSIQLISALFMQLVQTASMEDGQDEGKRKRTALKRRANDEASSDENESEDGMDMDEVDDSKASDDEFSRLEQKSEQLFANSAKSAQEIIAYIVGKASKVSKSGDSPYRNLLDLFVEDLVNVLPSSEWPAAELLLRILAARMTDLARHEKGAMTKNMALESLGTMGSAISTLRATVRDLSSNLSRDGETSSSSISSHLTKLADDQLIAGLRNQDLIALDGPFAIASRHFVHRSNQSLREKSARSYFFAQYAKVVCLALKTGDIDTETLELDAESSNIVSNVLGLISEAGTDTSAVFGEENSTKQEAHLAYLLSVLNLGFCRRFGTIVKTLSSSFSSEQAQVRSRSLKSVVTMLETDSTLLDRDPTIADDVFRCASDDSAMVRDSALSLIAKFIVSKPALEEKGIKRLLECACDSKIGVQKRAIGHLKDIYNQDSRPKLKAAIAQTFLRRTADAEESVADLGRRTLTDIWIAPYLGLAIDASDSAKASVAIESLTAHIVDSLQHDQSELTPLLNEFIDWSFKTQKATDHLNELCKRIVNVLFQSIIAGSATQPSLMTLMAFAESRPESVAPQQLSNLRRYLSNIDSNEDLFMFKSVIGIFRHVLPRLSSTHNALLKDIQDALMKSINKIGRRLEMDEVMSCLRTIDGVLHNTVRLVKLLASVVTQITNPDLKLVLRGKLLRIAGSLGKHIDFESQVRQIQNDIKSYRGGSVSGFLADTLYPYTLTDQPIEIRPLALESLGSICQAWPAQFNKPVIRDMFYSILEGKTLDNMAVQEQVKMQTVVLTMFEELYGSRAATQDESGKEVDSGEQVQDLKKLGGSTKTRDEDSAVALITGDVFNRVLKIALSEQGEKALLAVRTLASISHQGMIHPKQSTAAFVALETSPDQEVQRISQKAHQLLHQQHESVCEREYMNAVHEAFLYQVQLFQDSAGALQQGKAKLTPCFTIINTSGSKYVKKFLSNLVSRLSTDHTKLDVSTSMPDHVLFVRFVTQNLAFFEYSKMDELLHVILQLELAFSKNGAEIAQGIETMLQLGAAAPIMDNDLENLDHAQAVPAPAQHLDPVVSKQLAAAACAVTMISEARSHLRRQYGITRDVKTALQQNKQAKEATKAPLKVHGISGERFWNNSRGILSSLSDNESIITRCKAFVELMATDEEVRVGEEGDETRESHSMSVDPEGYQGQPRGKKRKKSNAGSASGTPKKARGRSTKVSTGTPGRRSTSWSSREDPDADFEG